MLLYKGEKNVLAFRSSVMEELEAVENYLLRGAYQCFQPTAVQILFEQERKHWIMTSLPGW